MTTKKHFSSKPFRLPPFSSCEIQHGLPHLRVSPRSKHPQNLPKLGELPAIAGLLLYPDKREKMVTTSEIEFSPKPYTRTEPKKILQCSLILEGERSFVTTNQEAYRSELGGICPLNSRRNVLKHEPNIYQTNYQQNFRPQGLYTRRLQTLPCPDNLVINPALRADFRTVQMDTYPGWDISLHSRPFPVQLKEQLSLKEDLIHPGFSSRKVSSFIASVRGR